MSLKWWTDHKRPRECQMPTRTCRGSLLPLVKVMKGVVLFGWERLIRSKGTVLTEESTRCNCVVNAPFAQPMLLQLDQSSMSVSVCVCVCKHGCELV